MTTPDLILLLTRPAAAGTAFVSSLTPGLRARARIVLSPLIDIIPLVQSVDTGDARGLVFSSAQGVRIFAGVNPTRVLPCYCVGTATTKAAIEAGFSAECAGHTADDLVANLTGRGPDAPLLHLAGLHVRGEVAERLTAAGITTQRIAIYDQPERLLTEKARSALDGELPVILTLFSPRTAQLFADAYGDSSGGTALSFVTIAAATVDSALVWCIFCERVCHHICLWCVVISSSFISKFVTTPFPLFDTAWPVGKVVFSVAYAQPQQYQYGKEFHFL